MIGVALYEMVEWGAFAGNTVLLIVAVALAFLSPVLRFDPTPGVEDAPAPDAPPASQPGPEGNR